nr:transposase (putative), gypsy type [Tanacetum cinerariifolium]
MATVRLFRCFYVDDFACPSSFPWHTAKHVTRDPNPVAADFNAQDYATLVAHPSSFWKFPEAFMCLVGLSHHYTLDKETYPRFLHKNGEEMDIFAFIHTLDPTKVRVVERERNKDEPRLMDTTIGRTVPLLPVAPDRADSELEASVERLLDEGGSGNQTEQGDFARGGPDANIQPVVEDMNTVVEDADLVQLRCQWKRKYVVVDAGRVSHHPKKLREDHETPSGTSVGAFVSTTPEREDGDHTDFVAEPNLHTIGAPQRFNISSYSSHYFGTNVAEAEKFVEPSPFGAGSSSVGGTDPITGVFSDLTGSDFLVCAIRIVINLETDLQKVCVPQWSVTNGSRLDDGRVCHEMVDEFSPPKFFASGELLKAREEEIESLKAWLLLRETEAAEAIRLRVEASNFETVEKSFWDETDALKERNVIFEKERNALDVKVTELETSAMSKEGELTDSNALVTSVKSQTDSLTDRVHELEISSFGLQEKVTVYENCMEQLEKFQDDRMKIVEDKFDKLYTDFVEMALHSEEKFYPHLLTIISGRRWLLTHGMKLAVANCLNSPKYLSALEATIGKAIEKGMQDGLSAGITHGKEGKVLSNVAAYNPSAEVDYISALQQFQNVNLSLLARLKSSKDASVETMMDILRLEGPLAEKLGLNELQPNVDLMVPIHHSPDQVVVGATALTIAPISVDDYKVMGADDQAGADENAASFPSIDDAKLNLSQRLVCNIAVACDLFDAVILLILGLQYLLRAYK